MSEELNTLIHLFEKQVAKNPQKTALIFQEKKFSFGELNEISNQLGVYLRSTHNIKSDDLIAVKLERSEWLIISLLGILKSGAAYVPIDPDFPQERIDFILNDSQCKTLIDEEAIKLFLSQKNKYDTKNISSINTTNDLAYVLYTSGTTGNPKGCMLEHKSVVNRISWQWHQFNYTTNDVILQKTTYTFDVSVWEIFIPLCFGAALVLCGKDDIASPQKILHLIEKHNITCVHFVPSMLAVFISMLWKENDVEKKLSSLTNVISSGEILSTDVVKKWYEKTNTPLHNLYGPTEAAIDVSFYTTQKNDAQIPIGKAIWNTQLYVLDDEQNFLAENEVGEICIAGIGLARGYLNNTDLTAEKFITKNGVRLYKTGDIGKFLSDGNLYFLGRKDEQIKFNGYRIELNEISKTLESTDFIEQAVCLPIVVDEKVKRLIAFVKMKSQENFSEKEIKNQLQKKLPAYMIPSEIVAVQAFPHTGGLKIDKKKLLLDYLLNQS